MLVAAMEDCRRGGLDRVWVGAGEEEVLALGAGEEEGAVAVWAGVATGAPGSGRRLQGWAVGTGG